MAWFGTGKLPSALIQQDCYRFQPVRQRSDQHVTVYRSSTVVVAPSVVLDSSLQIRKPRCRLVDLSDYDPLLTIVHECADVVQAVDVRYMGLHQGIPHAAHTIIKSSSSILLFAFIFRKRKIIYRTVQIQFFLFFIKAFSRKKIFRKFGVAKGGFIWESS